MTPVEETSKKKRHVSLENGEMKPRSTSIHQVVTMETIVVTMENFGGNTGKKNTTTEKHTRQLVFAT